MIDPLSQISSANSYANLAAARNISSNKVKEEFLTMFYRELLKQSFKAPDLTFKSNDEEQSNENTFISSFNSDMMVQKLAEQMAKQASVQLGWRQKESNNP